ncbi:MAG: penicillin-binding protein 2 [Bacteroidales bacterium]|nr:penicillin-binding protein 2 [Bacteroidales bacterium]
MDQFSGRRFIIISLILITGLVFTFRLLYLQVFDSTYELSAESNTRRLEIIYPARGLVYDRNGQLMVHNQPSYDLKIAPYELEAFDTVELCELLNISADEVVEAIKRRKKSPRTRHEPFIKQLSPETFGRLVEKQYKYPGFYFSLRTLRKYEYETAAHLLGYVGEVDSGDIQKDRYYEMGDYIGITGIEKTYEKFLRGEKGKRYRQIDNRGRDIGSYKEGRHDEDAVAGRNVTLTIDLGLQRYGESLMSGYKGSAIAIEPETGEVLAFISAPTYNPSLLIGRDREKNVNSFRRDTLKPLYNNAIQAQYPPGSTFKTVVALTGMQEKVFYPTTQFGCRHGYYARGVSLKCHSHPSPFKLVPAVGNSCNSYFCHVYKRIMEDSDYKSTNEAYSNWRNHTLSFGFDHPLGIDLPYEMKGLVPKDSYYDRYYTKGHWSAHTIISNSIGQGEILATPLQIANLASIIANRGYYVIPHVVKSVDGIDTIANKYLERNYTTVDTSHFESVVEGMEFAVNENLGTAIAVRPRNFIMCGKTGTAQNPHGEDHSVFMAFAPKDDPQIAISVYVENGVWGIRYAAKIASLMVERYLTDTITTPNLKWYEHWLRDNTIIPVDTSETKN